MFWIEKFNGGPEQTFVVQYRCDTSTQWINRTDGHPEIQFKNTHKLVVSNMQPKTRYLVRVLAYNKYGCKGFTKEREALTVEGKIIYN